MSTNQSMNGLETMTVIRRREALEAIENALEQRGMSPADNFERICDEKDLARFIAEVFAKNNSDAIQHFDKIKHLMGSENFFDPIKWNNFFGKTPLYNHDQRPHPDSYGNSPLYPWTAHMLNSGDVSYESAKIKNTHFGFYLPKKLFIRDWIEYFQKPVLDLSTIKLSYDMRTTLGRTYLESDYHSSRNNIWYLMPKVFPLITAKSEKPLQQCLIAPTGYSHADFLEVLTYQILYYLLQGEMPFTDQQIVCRNGISSSNEVSQYILTTTKEDGYYEIDYTTESNYTFDSKLRLAIKKDIPYFYPHPERYPR